MCTTPCECASHPVGLSNICWTVSVCSLCESQHSPIFGSSPGVSVWSPLLAKTLRRLKWGFCLKTVTRIGDLLYHQEVPVWCYTRQKSPICLLLFLNVFHLLSISVHSFSLRSCHPCHSLSLSPSLLTICVTVFRLIDSTSWAWHK